jgi:predicted RNase H-related nuclease YkuK (DUF458 family)
MIDLMFKKFDGTIITDVNQYVVDWLARYPYSEVFIGADSQKHKRVVKYSITICLHHIDESGIGRGCHVIFAIHVSKDFLRKEEKFNRLWKEAELAITAAKMIEKCGKKITIHLDYNSDEACYSNILYAAGIGLCKEEGFEALGKPYAPIASICADKLCH